MFRRLPLGLLVILLLAAALRFYRLDAQSLWADEGSSVAQALRDVPTIAANAARDIHPPLYYIALHFWVSAFGASEVAVRALSAALGVALVWLCYLLGAALWDERTGLIAAFLAAINPFQIYYAQEARMYMLMAVLGAVCVYATIKVQGTADGGRTTDDGRRTMWYGVYLIAAVMGLYTHYFFPIVLVVCNVIVAMTWLKSRNGLGRWILLQLLALLAFLPWLPTAIRQITTWPSGAQTFAASDAPVVLLRTLSLGLSAPRDDGVWLVLFGVLAAIGLYTGKQGNRETGKRVYLPTCVPVYLLVPVFVMFALALFKDAFLKFMLVASPPVVLLVANGISRIAHRASRIANGRWPMANRNAFDASRITHHALRLTHYASRITFFFLLSSLLIPSALSLQTYYFDPRFARDDYRAIAQTIDALAHADDAIILNAPGQQEIFAYYYHGASPVYPLPRERPINVMATESELADIATRHPHVFVVLWATDESDPTRVVESWLDAHAFKASDDWYGNVRLVSYASQRVSNEMQQAVVAHFGDALTLQGYTLGVNTINAGEVLPLTLFWRAEQPITQRYKVFAHLLDPRGFVVAQRDAEPVGGSRPTTTWPRGEVVVDPYGLVIPFGAPPLAYQIEVGLYDPNTGARLKLATGDDHLLLSPVTVQATNAPRAIPGLTPLSVATTNGLALIGYRVDKVGAEGQREVVFHAGDALHLTLFWRKAQPTTGDGAYRLQLGTWMKQTTPTDGLYPVAQWNVVAVVRDDQLITLPSDWRAGRYALMVDSATITEVDVQ